MRTTGLLMISLIVTLILGACTTDREDKEASGLEDKLMNSFIGHPQSDLIAKWGPPSRTESDEDGGSILIYEITDPNLQHVYTAPGSGLRYNIPIPRGTRTFHVNEQGIVSRWSWKGF